ncbi:glycosyltransferase family 4 protein [Pedobacter boryungensis]|uniref:Glycosyltransferase family 4 protein n=1 Tax=Pedobacter boryungensis TaxID=869962 RepID=A0ABX2D7Z0_9SPHI|nr:glycosyltransferase family 4 protein [Pedobacter boryungensis]NQX30170.1 glycosyltransferase family 4 protein [Pedobacter boryungensis]
MKIAIIADPFIPIPPLNYGGIERIIDFLVHGLKERGHEVILIAHPDSKVEVPLIKYKNQNTRIATLQNILTINKLKSFKPDVIHSFGRLINLLPFLSSNTPKIMSYQREPTLSQIRKAVFLSKKHTLSFTGCSDYISNQIKPFAVAATVYNGFPILTYHPKFEYNEDAPLVFLGRIEYIKGTHIAIEVAKKANKRLIIAGNIPPNEEEYFNQKVKPFLSGEIEYIGPVNDIEKNALLGNALAFLMPIQWNEPFGIVMAEAMACGTPVIGFSRGSVPEVVDDNITGFVCTTQDDMVVAIGKLDSINRETVFQTAMRRFSSDSIVSEYLKIYEARINKN